MKLPPHIFALGQNEQRVVILTVLLLLAGAVAKHYRAQLFHNASPAMTQPNPAPPLKATEEDEAK
jgi:hypothetical protein